MCTEKDNEELIEALVKAARAAVLSLKETTNLLDKRASELSDDELYGVEWGVRIDSMEKALKRLDDSGLFGTGKALLSEYLEICE